MNRLISLLPYLSFLCFALLIAGCQKENQTAEVLTPNETLEATERSCVAGCQQCSIQDFCCCRIDLRFPTTGMYQVQFCGDLPGCAAIDTCHISASGNCPEIRGILVNDNIEFGIPYFYCQEKDEAIRITNLDNEDIVIRITCIEPDSAGPAPPITDVFIPSLGSKSIFLNSDCEAEECH